jgi:hypothetical protein
VCLQYPIVTYVVALDPRGKVPLDLANLTSIKQALCIAYARNLILKKPLIVERARELGAEKARSRAAAEEVAAAGGNPGAANGGHDEGKGHVDDERMHMPPAFGSGGHRRSSSSSDLLGANGHRRFSSASTSNFAAAAAVSSAHVASPIRTGSTSNASPTPANGHSSRAPPFVRADATTTATANGEGKGEVPSPLQSSPSFNTAGAPSRMPILPPNQFNDLITKAHDLGMKSIREDERSGWKLTQTKDGVEVWMKQDDGSNITCTKGVGEIQAPAEAIWFVWNNHNYRAQWDDMWDRGSTVEDLDSLTTCAWTQFKAPWPVSARDFVVVGRTFVS